MFDNQSRLLMFSSPNQNSIKPAIAVVRGNHKMAMIDEGEDLIETGEEVVAKVKQFLQSGCACSKSIYKYRSSWREEKTIFAK